MAAMLAAGYDDLGGLAGGVTGDERRRARSGVATAFHRRSGWLKF
jgi:hypothetical protein